MSRPLTFSGLDLATVRLEVVPTSAILTPSRSTMMYGLTSRVPSSLKMFAPICLSLVPGTMRSIRSLYPLSNSWLPTAMPSVPMALTKSIVYLSSEIAEINAEPPWLSPELVTMVFGFLERM